MVYVREYEGQQVLICLNFTAHPTEVDLSRAGDGAWRCVFSTAAHGQRVPRGEVTLYANEALVLERARG